MRGIWHSFTRREATPEPAARDPPSSALMPLTKWFGPTAEIHGGILRVTAETAADLLATQHDVVVLHGDMHHENVPGLAHADGWP